MAATATTPHERALLCAAIVLVLNFAHDLYSWPAYQPRWWILTQTRFWSTNLLVSMALLTTCMRAAHSLSLPSHADAKSSHHVDPHRSPATISSAARLLYLHVSTLVASASCADVLFWMLVESAQVWSWRSPLSFDAFTWSTEAAAAAAMREHAPRFLLTSDVATLLMHGGISASTNVMSSSSSSSPHDLFALHAHDATGVAYHLRTTMSLIIVMSAALYTLRHARALLVVVLLHVDTASSSSPSLRLPPHAPRLQRYRAVAVDDDPALSSHASDGHECDHGDGDGDGDGEGDGDKVNDIADDAMHRGSAPLWRESHAWLWWLGWTVALTTINAFCWCHRAIVPLLFGFVIVGGGLSSVATFASSAPLVFALVVYVLISALVHLLVLTRIRVRLL